MHREPALAQRTEHAHGLDGFGIVQMAGGQLRRLLGKTAGVTQRLFGQVLVQAGQADQQHRARRGQYAKPHVEQENHEQVDGKPGRVEKREQRRPRNELANVGQIAQGLPCMPLPALQVAFERGLVDAQVETSLQLAADADHHKTADHFQQANKGKEPDDHQRQHHQRRFILGGQHAVVHLQHINRWHQHQQVNQGGKTANADQDALVFTQRLEQGRNSLGLGHIFLSSLNPDNAQ
ncbi:hypothetical protein [Pseudomonas sp. 34 E 7]|nr:hypothetical protein [Pseudomonas sp. 34 E 7]